jgi:hypothetical protein
MRNMGFELRVTALCGEKPYRKFGELPQDFSGNYLAIVYIWVHTDL